MQIESKKTKKKNKKRKTDEETKISAVIPESTQYVAALCYS